jgi:hypothetical protein
MRKSLLRGLDSAANDDPEFRIAARLWNGAVRLALGEDAHVIRVKDGQIASIVPDAEGAGAWDVSISAPAEDWDRFLDPVPKPFYQDLWGATIHHGFEMTGDLEALLPYYPAMRRLFELMRARA